MTPEVPPLPIAETLTLLATDEFVTATPVTEELLKEIVILESVVPVIRLCEVLIPAGYAFSIVTESPTKNGFPAFSGNVTTVVAPVVIPAID